MQGQFVRKVALVAALFVGSALAQPAAAQNKLNIVGTVNIYQTPPGPIGNVVLDFLMPTDTGSGAIFKLPSFGVFAAIPDFTLGTHADLAFGPINPPPAGTPAPTPVGVPVAPTFLFAIGGYTFNATFFFPGTVPGTPFTLVQSGPNVDAHMSVRGIVSGGAFGGGVGFDGIYSTQFTNLTIPQLIARIEAGTVVPSSVSSSFEANVVPEPATLVLTASGLVTLVGVGLRRRRTNG